MLPAASSWAGDGQHRQQVTAGRGAGEPSEVLAPLWAAQGSLDVQRKVLAACPELVQGLSRPKSPPQALVPLSCFAAAPLAGGMEGCSLPAAMEDSGVRVLPHRERLLALVGLLPVSAPLVRPRQASPIGSSCPPRTPQQRRVSLALLPQAKYSVWPWPTTQQGRWTGAPVQIFSCTEQGVGWGSPCGRARWASSSPQAPILEVLGSEQGRVCHILPTTGQRLLWSGLVAASISFMSLLFIPSTMGWQRGAAQQQYAVFTPSGWAHASPLTSRCCHTAPAKSLGKVPRGWVLRAGDIRHIRT